MYRRSTIFSDLPSELRAHIAAYLPPSEQFRLHAAITRTPSYALTDLEFVNPLAANALLQGGAWLNLARAAHGEVQAQLGHDALQQLRGTQPSWHSIHEVIQHSPGHVHAAAFSLVAQSARDAGERFLLRTSGNVESRVLTALASNASNVDERAALAAHPKADDATLASLARAQDNPPEFFELLDNEVAGARTLLALAERAPTAEQQCAIRAHPAVNDETLAELAFRSFAEPHMRIDLLNHDAAGDRTLANLAWHSNDDVERQAILHHPRTSDRAVVALLRYARNTHEFNALQHHPGAGTRVQKIFTQLGTERARRASIAKCRDWSLSRKLICILMDKSKAAHQALISVVVDWRAPEYVGLSDFSTQFFFNRYR